MTTLRNALRSFDGKAVSILSEIRAELGGRETFVAELVSLAADYEGTVSDGATWLIKNLLDEGARLTPSQTEDLIGRLDAITTWQAQLHICQAVRHLDVPAQQAGAFADWLTPLLRSDRPFSAHVVDGRFAAPRRTERGPGNARRDCPSTPRSRIPRRRYALAPVTGEKPLN